MKGETTCLIVPLLKIHITSIPEFDTFACVDLTSENVDQQSATYFEWIMHMIIE